MSKFRKYDPDDLEHLKQLELMILKEIISICESHNLKYYAYGGTALGAIRHGGFIPWDDDVDIAMFREDYEKLLEILDSELNENYYVITLCKQDGFFLPFSQICLKGTKFENSEVFYGSVGKGINIDIFPLDNVPESDTKRKIQHHTYIIRSHLLANSIYNIKTSNKIYSIIHSLLHIALNIISKPKILKKKLYKCLTKYNKEKTNYVTVFYSQDDFLKFGKYGFFDRRDFEPSRKVKFEDIEINMPNNYDKILKTYYGDYMTLPPEEKRYNTAADMLDFGEY